jgi:peptide deformylase
VGVRDVLRYPNPALKAVARPLSFPADAAEAGRVAGDLLDTMRSMSFTTGVAATQLGELVRVVVVDVTGHKRTTACHGEVVLVNPVVLATSGETEVGREGCLSLPDLTANVRRPVWVVVTGLDAEGADVEIRTEGFEARCLLHEIDHLDGILFLDRVDSLSRDLFRRKKYR